MIFKGYYMYIYISCNCIHIFDCHTWEPFTAKFLIYTCSQFQERSFCRTKRAPAACWEASTGLLIIYTCSKFLERPSCRTKKRLRHARRTRQGFLNQQSSAIRPYSPLFAAIRRYSPLCSGICRYINCNIRSYRRYSPLFAANSAQNRLP